MLRRVLPAVAVCAILAAPAAIAFFAGGFFDESRLVAGLGACALLLLAALAAERPLPCHWPARLALSSLAGLALWSTLSLTWAPLGGPASDDAQRLALYVLGLAAATAWLGSRRAAAATEPGLTLGCLVVVGYGLSERMLPGVLEFARSGGAGDRLEQPLTYWNGMGALAVLGIVLSARLAGSDERAPALRAAAAAAIPTLAAGLYLTYSRGALGALAVGMLALLALAPGRSQLRAAGVAALLGGLGLALAAALPEVSKLDGGESQGALLLAGLLLLGAAAAGAQLVLARREAAGRLAPGRVGGRMVAGLAVGVVLAITVTAVLVAGSGGDGSRGAAPGAGAQRLATLESSRYDYWVAALDSFAANPLRGVGAAGFRVEWQRERGRRLNARDAHSLYIETAAELGLVGLLLLAGLLAGVVVSACRARAAMPALAAGPAAALIAYGFHAGLDWDWELPAVTLPALALAGLLLAAGDRDRTRS